ncbi:MAG: hypothetical protein GOVbin1573_17 [Prokaryotic dsDNA virus sp.]|nr:MAG: hypothetical protein GOVbin1573_17 [Prokaryotic dsDNA virus sp.]|tara:strand:- start:814 stop:1203 length:390 start_codon:yes stop_codon:yes gene_type:complete
MTRAETLRALPEKNRRVVAKVEGTCEHSGAEWRREGWAFMAWWGDTPEAIDGWNDRLWHAACDAVGADHIHVVGWFYPEDAILRALAEEEGDPKPGDKRLEPRLRGVPVDVEKELVNMLRGAALPAPEI